MSIDYAIGNIRGLPAAEQQLFDELMKVYTAHIGKNREKHEYYEGDIPLSRVNLGIALPQDLQRLEIGCDWGAKAVDVLAARSMFDGFVGINGEDVDELNAIAEANRLLAAYPQAARDELKLGCVLATLSADAKIGCKIRFHSLSTAAALWDGNLGRIKAGMAIIDTAPDNLSADTWSPSVINLYTDKAIWVLSRNGSSWTAKGHRHKMGRPLMEPMIWNATSSKPFGRSRIKKSVRHMIEGYVRTIANATIGLEFATSPQKYLLGITDEQYEKVVNEKFRQYVGSIISATYNPDTGEKPDFGQLSQGNIKPHVDMLRMLATQFSAATGLSVTDTGVINDANPTSSDAIEAQSKTLITLAGDLNTGNGEALTTIGRMALAISRNSTLEELPEELLNIKPKFRNPAMPSVAATADAAVKIAGARPGFASTDVFLEMLGFDAATIRRIKGQEQRARGLAVLQELEGGA